MQIADNGITEMELSQMVTFAAVTIHDQKKIPFHRMRPLREHIDSFPRVPAHWCRANTQKEYLEASLNKSSMYQLYLDFCKEKDETPVGKTTYMEELIKKTLGFTHQRKTAVSVFFPRAVRRGKGETKIEVRRTHQKQNSC